MRYPAEAALAGDLKRHAPRIVKAYFQRITEVLNAPQSHPLLARHLIPLSFLRHHMRSRRPTVHAIEVIGIIIKLSVPCGVHLHPRVVNRS